MQHSCHIAALTLPTVTPRGSVIAQNCSTACSNCFKLGLGPRWPTASLPRRSSGSSRLRCQLARACVMKARARASYRQGLLKLRPREGAQRHLRPETLSSASLAHAAASAEAEACSENMISSKTHVSHHIPACMLQLCNAMTCSARLYFLITHQAPSRRPSQSTPRASVASRTSEQARC